MAARARPIWKEMQANLKAQREESQARRSSSLEENHRRVTLRRAQAMAKLGSDKPLREAFATAFPEGLTPANIYGHGESAACTLPRVSARRAVHRAPSARRRGRRRHRLLHARLP